LTENRPSKTVITQHRSGGFLFFVFYFALNQISKIIKLKIY